jgi:hypothetical protein
MTTVMFNESVSEFALSICRNVYGSEKNITITTDCNVFCTAMWSDFKMHENLDSVLYNWFRMPDK